MILFHSVEHCCETRLALFARVLHKILHSNLPAINLESRDFFLLFILYVPQFLQLDVGNCIGSFVGLFNDLGEVMMGQPYLDRFEARAVSFGRKIVF